MYIIKRTVGAIVAGIILAFSAGTISAADSSSPIKIPLKNWSSQLVMAYVIGGICV
jgi:glycine betaine/proline transport system substrate-binding protein